MRQSLCARLGRLEQSGGFRVQTADTATASAANWIQKYLVDWGITQSENESLRDAFARGLGMTTDELRAHLAEMRNSPSAFRGNV